MSAEISMESLLIFICINYRPTVSAETVLTHGCHNHLLCIVVHVNKNISRIFQFVYIHETVLLPPCIMMASYLQQYKHSDQIKDDEIEGECSTSGVYEKCIQLFVGKPEGRYRYRCRW